MLFPCSFEINGKFQQYLSLTSRLMFCFYKNKPCLNINLNKMNSNTTTTTRRYLQDLSAANIFNQLLHHLWVPPFCQIIWVLGTHGSFSLIIFIFPNNCGILLNIHSYWIHIWWLYFFVLSWFLTWSNVSDNIVVLWRMSN